MWGCGFKGCGFEGGIRSHAWLCKLGPLVTAGSAPATPGWTCHQRWAGQQGAGCELKAEFRAFTCNRAPHLKRRIMRWSVQDLSLLTISSSCRQAGNRRWREGGSAVRDGAPVRQAGRVQQNRQDADITGQCSACPVPQAAARRLRAAFPSMPQSSLRLAAVTTDC